MSSTIFTNNHFFIFAAGDSVEVCVYAIEMVYIPTGAFYVGDRVAFVHNLPSFLWQVLQQNLFKLRQKQN